MLKFRILLLAASVVCAASAASAQTAGAQRPPAPTPAVPSPAPAAQAPAPSGAAPKPTGSLSLCNGAYNIGPPAKLPPAGSGPLVYLVALCFAKQGGTSVIDPQTYLYYIQLRWSLPSQDKWVPYTDASEDQIQRDFKALWGTNFLDDLSAETRGLRLLQRRRRQDRRSTTWRSGSASRSSTTSDRRRSSSRRSTRS